MFQYEIVLLTAVHILTQVIKLFSLFFPGFMMIPQ